MICLPLVDILASSSTPVVTGLAGGSLDITSAAASPDGKRAIAVGTYTASTKTKAYAFSYAAGASQATAVDLSALLDEAGGVRFLPDGKRAIVAGFKRTGAIPTGILLVFDPLLGASPEQIRLAASTQPSSLLIHPNGKHAYVSNRTQYSPPCCGQLRIVALETKAEVYASGFFDPGGPEFQLNAAVRLPYAPFRVLAGQSDNGNNRHGPVVELGAGGMAPTKVEVMGNDDIGSIDALATPFGTPF